jgi:hypothetical protein
MPIISEKDLAKIQKTIALANSRAFNEQRTRERQIGVARFSAEAVLTAALMGYARGYIEKRGPDSKFVIPYTNADAELVLGLGGLGGALVGGKYLGRYEEDVLAASLGMLSHYAGQVGRQSAITGTFSAVAGAGEVPELIGRHHHPLFGGSHHHYTRAGADSLAELLNEVP